MIAKFTLFILKELRGAESVIINLSNALVNLDNQVCIINNC